MRPGFAWTSILALALGGIPSAMLAQPAVPGDFNGDGCVDESDYTKLQSGWQQTYTIDDVQAFLTNYGGAGCVPRLSFDGTDASGDEGGTVGITILASQPFSGPIRYSVQNDSPLPIGQSPAVITTGTINITGSPPQANLQISIPSTFGYQIGENLVVALQADDHATPIYRLGLRSTKSISLRESGALASGLWAAEITLNQREEQVGGNPLREPLPVGISVPLLFEIDPVSGNVRTVNLPELRPDLPYIRQTSDPGFGSYTYSPMPTITTRPGTVVSGNLSGDTLNLTVSYDVAPVIWQYGRTGESKVATRTLSVTFDLAGQDRLVNVINAKKLNPDGDEREQMVRETTVFSGTSVNSTLVGTGVLQFHALGVYPASNSAKTIKSSNPSRSKQFVEAETKRAAREKAAQALTVYPPSYQVPLSVAAYQNRSDLASSGSSFFLGGGGAVRAPATGQPGCVTSIGQPVAGLIRYEEAVADLRSQADAKRDNATQFLSDLGVTKGGTPISRVSGSATADEQYQTSAGGTLIFDGAQLAESEALYVTALSIDPYDTSVLGGLLETRLRRALWYNLLADRQALIAWNVKYEFPSLAGKTTLEKEQDEFETAAGHALTAARLLLSMFDDRQALGVGTVMRRERSDSIQDAIEPKRREVLEVAAGSMRRWAEAKGRVIHFDLLKGFFDIDSRDAALDASIAAQVMLDEAIRLLSIYAQPEVLVPGATPDLDLLYFSNSQLVVLAAERGKMQGVEQDIRQGLNAFGFVPDFVPFLVTNNQSSESDNVVRARQLASSLIALTRSYESDAEFNLNQFVNDAAEYDQRINDLTTSYDERLRALCGVIELQKTDGSALPAGIARFSPDLLTYAMPPGNDITPETPAQDRDDLLENSALQSAGYKFVRRSYGQIWTQQLNIQNALDRIEQAQQDLQNNYKQMEIIEDTANQVATEQDRIVALIKSSGEQVTLLIREQGRLRQEAALAEARAQKKANKKSGAFGAIGQVVAGAVSGFLAGGPAGAVAGAVYAGIAGGVIQGSLTLASSAAQTKALTQIGNIQADLAVAEANIAAQIHEIEYLQSAEILFSERNIGLLRAEEQLKSLALQQARLSLSIRIAERDYLRELAVLDNMMAEIDSLIAEEARHAQLAALQSGIVDGYSRRDYRAAFQASQADSEAGFERAQAATFIAVRALEYYLNESQSIGSIYDKLYSARRTTHLDAVLTDIDQAITLNPVIIASDCPNESVLSLKYHLLSTADVTLAGQTPGSEVLLGGPAYQYYDSVTQQTLSGESAYQARLRDFLRQSLTATAGNRRLEFQFATDVFQRSVPNSDAPLPGEPTDYIFAQNPLFNSGNTRSQTVIGFTPQQCQTQTGQTFHGITLNLVGNGIPTSQRIVLTLSQVGNQYLRTGRQDSVFDPNDQLSGMNIYSSYRQSFPKTLRLSGTGESSYEILPGSRQADFSPRVNGVLPQGATGRTLVFTDRSIACDKWLLIMDEKTQGQGTPEFLRLLDQALTAAYDPTNPQPFTFVTDIQMRIGWVPKFAQ